MYPHHACGLRNTTLSQPHTSWQRPPDGMEVLTHLCGWTGHESQSYRDTKVWETSAKGVKLRAEHLYIER